MEPTRLESPLILILVPNMWTRDGGFLMSRLQLRTIADAPEEAKESLTAVEKRNGFLPNLLGVLANAPVALETYLTVSAINTRGSLTLAQREAVQITAAATHG